MLLPPMKGLENHNTQAHRSGRLKQPESRVVPDGRRAGLCSDPPWIARHEWHRLALEAKTSDSPLPQCCHD